jgi:hypothetical protein
MVWNYFDGTYSPWRSRVPSLGGLFFCKMGWMSFTTLCPLYNCKTMEQRIASEAHMKINIIQSTASTCKGGYLAVHITEWPQL